MSGYSGFSDSYKEFKRRQAARKAAASGDNIPNSVIQESLAAEKERATSASILKSVIQESLAAEAKREAEAKKTRKNIKDFLISGITPEELISMGYNSSNIGAFESTRPPVPSAPPQNFFTKYPSPPVIVPKPTGPKPPPVPSAPPQNFFASYSPPKPPRAPSGSQNPFANYSPPKPPRAPSALPPKPSGSRPSWTNPNTGSSSSSMDISTLENINRWVQTTYRVNMSDPDIMTSREDDSEELGERFIREAVRYHRENKIQLLPGKTLNEFRRITDTLSRDYHMIQNTGGGKNDCLIISFLMGVSSAYRKLDYDNKYKCASEFRRNLLPDLLENTRDPKIRSKQTLRQDIKSLKTQNFLFDSHINLLSGLYKVRIISLETAKEGRMEGETIYQPPTVNDIGGDYTNRDEYRNGGIIICNRSNGHYEIVSQKRPPKYFYSDAELTNFYDFIQNSNPFKGGKVTGEESHNILESSGIIREGARVMYNGQTYFIVGRDIEINMSGNPRPVGFWISKISKEYPTSKYEKIPGLLQTKGTDQIMYVLPADIRINRSGGRRKTRKLRKAARKSRKAYRRN
jgi:hypothetical protein